MVLLRDGEVLLRAAEVALRATVEALLRAAEVVVRADAVLLRAGLVLRAADAVRFAGRVLVLAEPPPRRPSLRSALARACTRSPLRNAEIPVTPRLRSCPRICSAVIWAMSLGLLLPALIVRFLVAVALPPRLELLR
ncbi:hypothetical protein [Micromonospora sp. NBC_01796]|uniref:hypothetical protein n=1 Tax=Micromonospora sp. NBC_01796 TaxID=2975987 RepID=UPI003FA354E1